MAINFLISQNIDGGITTSSSSTLAGINMTSGLAMGNNNISGVNDIQMAGTLTLNDELNMESGSDILMSATGNIQIDGDSGTGKFLKSVASGMEWVAITQNAGTVTSVGITAGAGISVSNSPITSSGNITVTNTITNNNQLTNGRGFTTNTGTVTSIATTSPITGGTITGSGTIALDQSAITALSNLVETGVVTGGVWNSNTQLNKTSSTLLDHQGEVVYWASSTVTKGKVYVYSGGDWINADADAESTSKGTLAVALNNGTSSSVGMFTRGTITLSDIGSDGDLVYLDTNAGNLTTEPPSGSGDVVRIVGQLLDSSNGQMFFNPDNTFITLS
tara:strand:+ start:32 stop:1030 length:999 start_codon:yes stop_codon:yes gene_type:complete